MPTYNLPPDTRATGTGSPAADMDSVVDVLNHTALQRIFYLDQYGADPTGVATSDAAWAACYSDALSAVQAETANGTGGAMIILGCGRYRFSVNTVVINDPRIGFAGQGRWATGISTTGSTGDILNFSNTASVGFQSAPVHGFGVYGWSAGAAVNGVHYGDRPNGCMTDVAVYGLTGTGCRGFWFHDAHGTLSEGSFFVLHADQNTVNYDFDGGGGGTTSFDYSHMFLHSVTKTNGSNVIALRFTGGQHCYGSSIHLAGNIVSNNASFTATGVQVGTSGTDASRINASFLQVSLECGAATGTVTDVVVNTAAGKGINNCSGTMNFLAAPSSFTAGSVTGGTLTCAGYVNGPLFAGHGSFSIGSNGATFSVYSG